MNQLSNLLSKSLATAVVTAAALGGNAFAGACKAKCGACAASAPHAKAKKTKAMAKCGACKAKCGAACAAKK